MQLCATKNIKLTEQMQSAEFYLQKYFGYKSFRLNQEEIIQNVLDKNDSIVLMPTGGGKSICYQLPAVMLDGLTVVISPLISLMKDQVVALRNNGIEAAYLNSSLGHGEESGIMQKLANNKLKLLYISPERLMAPNFIEELKCLKTELIAIDEAHCISGWGHDFRPEYAQLHLLKQNFPKVPIIALTATADKAVREDIADTLGIADAKLYVSSFDRPNLSLTVLPGQQRFKKIIDILHKFPDQCGIIYCSSRKQTEQLAEKLSLSGYEAACYHAGLDIQTRNKVQDDFSHGNVNIICATIAFGMGIDKSDVRFVIHYNLPKNLEGYYQEIGRAGRDGMPADTILFYSFADIANQMYFINQISDYHYRKIQEDKLDRIKEYAESQICRRKVLLSYFSEYAETDCGNCDVCQNPPKYLDGTTEAKMALSAIVRVHEQEGISQIVEILRGHSTPYIQSQGYDQIKTFGVGRNIAAIHWTVYLQQLVQQGILEIDYRNKNKLRLTAVSKDILKGEKPVKLVSFETVKSRNASIKQKKTKVPSDKSIDEGLFERLRVLRKTLATNSGKPPFTIFSDATLMQMSQLQPSTMQEMHEVSGVGDFKAEKFGQVFLEEIATYKSGAIVPKPFKRGQTHEVSLEMFQQGMTVKEIAEERELSSSTISGHLLELYQSGEEIDFSSMITDDILNQIRLASVELEQPKLLKPYFEFFKGEIDYDILRIGLAILEKEKV